MIASVPSSIDDEHQPALCDGAQRVDLQGFIERYGTRRVQERVLGGKMPRDFAMRRLGEFWSGAHDERPGWGPDEQPGRYVFHDEMVPDEWVAGFDELFEQHPPPDAFMDFSERLPCRAMRVAIGGPHSMTSLHYHGATVCLLLHGTKRWWLWPPAARDILWWLSCGLRARNRIACWEHDVAPHFVDREGDVRSVVRALWRELAKQGRFHPPGPEHPSYTAMCRLEAGEGPPVMAEHVRGISFTQHAGQIAFIPDAWCHAVHNTQWHLALIYELVSASELGALDDVA